jgi:transcriptional regulator with XRE-family HTH domain
LAVKLRLQELAQSKGLTLSQVQRRSGLTMTMVRRYWYNETSEVSLRALETLSELLQVAPGDLLTKEDAPHDDRKDELAAERE